MAVQVRFCYHIRFFKKQNKQMIPKAKLFEFLELQGFGKCRRDCGFYHWKLRRLRKCVRPGVGGREWSPPKLVVKGCIGGRLGAESLKDWQGLKSETGQQHRNPSPGCITQNLSRGKLGCIVNRVEYQDKNMGFM